MHEELHNLYHKSNVIRVIKLRKMRWALHVIHIGKGEGNVVPVLK